VIVLDSSAAADYLLRREPEASWVEAQLDDAAWNLHAPHVFDLEVTRAVRRYVLANERTDDEGRALIEGLLALRIRRYPHVPFLEGIWGLRDNFTVFDAAYVALAEALNVPLTTTDRILARTPGSGIEIRSP
jgi:predicted nucleic acid-binding protein